MTGFQSRVVDEHSELSLKINALRAFTVGAVFKTLEDIDKELLLRQLDTMSAYQHILEKRIARF
ncbi:hypothetical protein AU156_gp152 [Edwardsiella phage PEi20]|uniref:Uncharacterized protein n=2 Tax=Kanagawavirus pei20 TaxID=2844109 RepID=A0A0B6VT64_9CAUD|nr:hypothetical protein AU156_gp152 [Edwardsiella phage PEi20]BAQ22950.1 conserved hypothetical protein [Edwardsiella phage PEi20]BAQ23250.1 conserved hypothetical protein [Edwardsiella phage PEi26]